MKIETKGIQINLTQDELDLMLNIVEFSLDLHEERYKQNKPCMTDSELYMAKELVNILMRIR